MTERAGEHVRVDVHSLGEPLATSDRWTPPEEVLGIRVRASAVRASGRVEMRGGLLGRGPRCAGSNVLEDTLRLVVKASKGRTHEIAVDVV